MKDLIACTFSNSEHARTYAKRNAVIQIIVATAAFILMMRVFPMGLVQNHVLSRQNAYDSPAKALLAGEPFGAADKKLQMVYFTQDHLYQVTLYMGCTLGQKQADYESVRFRLYDDAFSCIYEEEADSRKIAKNGYLAAVPDLDVVKGQAYYYEILIDEESSAVYTLPVGNRTALAQAENATLYIDGIINEEVSLVADFDYSRPLTVFEILLYDVLIAAGAAVVYLLLLMLVQQYDERFSQEAFRVGSVGRIARISVAVLGVLASAALFVYAVVLNRFGGEVWDRLFFTAGIAAADAWLIGFLWRLPRTLRPQKRSKMPAGSIMWLTWRNYIQTVSFGLLFYALCQYVNADRNFYHYTNTRWMLIFLAVALLMNYHEKQFVNKLSLLWLVLGFAGSVYYCSFVQGDKNELLLARLTCGVVVSWGLLVLTILRMTAKTPELASACGQMTGRLVRDRQRLCYSVLWIVFSLFMYAYRYEKVWVFTATLPFAAFLFSPNTLASNCRFLKNFSNGILLSFALVTFFCLAHRPHHYWMLYRYGGIFHTVACTGMYLAVVFGTALAKLYGKLKTRKSMLTFCFPEYFVTACAAGFILLSMSRTAFLTTLVTVAMIVAVTAVAYEKGAVRILSELLMLMVVCLASFPMVFTAVRMVPAVVNDPVRYEIEFQDRSFMIYEGDPVDSDKYMTVRRFFATLFGRFQSAEGGQEADAGRDELTGREAGTLAFAGNALAGLEQRSVSQEVEKSPDISNGRFEIFQDYINAIRFRGHPKMGPEDPKGDEYAHAHNSYLQVAYNFGLVAGLLFLVLCALTLWRAVRLFLDYGSRYSIVLIPFSLVVVFGFISLTEWAYHPCIPAGFGFILMQMLLMRDCEGPAK